MMGLWAVTALLMAVCVAPLAARLPLSHSRRKATVSKMDEAALTINNELQKQIVVSSLSDHCYQCLFQPLGEVAASPWPGNTSTAGFTVGSQHPLTLQVNSSEEGIELCRLHFHFGEHGNYSLWVRDLNTSAGVNCSLVTVREPTSSDLPILVAFLVYVGLFCLAAIGSSIMRLDVTKNLLSRFGNGVETERLINSELGSPNRTLESSDSPIPPTAATSSRLRSLDTFRGLSLVIMVFVNYGGGKYWFFRHESWNGLTVADLVFPWFVFVVIACLGTVTSAVMMFVFIMGTSIALSVSGALSRGSTRIGLLGKVLWRSLQLFLIGLLIIHPNYCVGPLSLGSLRIPGVLQRLAITYLCVAALDLAVARPRLDNLPTEVWWYPVREVLFYWPAWLCVIAMETLWLCLTFLLPVPGCPTGYLGPGGIGDFGQYPNCTGGAAGYIDRVLLGEDHIYRNPSSRVLYLSTMPYDPEGVLGSINSVVMAFLGLQAGKIILHYKDLHSKIMARFLIWGFALGIISAILTKCSKDQGFIPINKNLWSLSYVTTLSCFAFVVLFMVYYVVDVKRWWSGAPFFYPGMNSILVYVGHEVFEEYFPFRWKMTNVQSHAEHLAQNLVATSVWVFISYVLYRKKVFWKI